MVKTQHMAFDVKTYEAPIFLEQLFSIADTKYGGAFIPVLLYLYLEPGAEDSVIFAASNASLDDLSDAEAVKLNGTPQILATINPNSLPQVFSFQLTAKFPKIIFFGFSVNGKAARLHVDVLTLTHGGTPEQLLVPYGK